MIRIGFFSFFSFFFFGGGGGGVRHTIGYKRESWEIVTNGSGFYSTSEFAAFLMRSVALGGVPHDTYGMTTSSVWGSVGCTGALVRPSVNLYTREPNTP